MEVKNMAVISKGIYLQYVSTNGDTPKVLTNLMEIPDMGGEKESIEITTLADSAHVFTDGIWNYGDSLSFKFLYEAEQFQTLFEISGEQLSWLVCLPDGTEFTFTGTASCKIDAVGVNAALTYTLSIKPNSAIELAY